MPPKIRFFTDEHISKAVIEGLRQRGVEVLSIPDAAMLGATDESILSKAKEEDYVVFTQDADFLRLHSSGIEHKGIAYTPRETSIGDVIRGLMLVFDVLEPEDMENHVEFIWSLLASSKTTLNPLPSLGRFHSKHVEC
jgi:Domain of unknown function (DUF5615)